MLTPITGALAGLFHVLSGPDHLAAVAPMAAAGPHRSWVSGWTWGIGHTSGVLVVAVCAVFLRELFPLEAVSAASERLVGGALVGIGLWAFRRSARVGPAAHAHGVVVHDHLHVQTGPRWMRRIGHAHTSFCMGVLHGVAGSSHFLGVLPALALPTRADALLYVAAFGAGTVAAMTGFAAAVGACARRFPVVGGRRTMLQAAALLAIVIGGVWLV